MAEKWKKAKKQGTVISREVVYDVTEETVVRSVQRNGLELEKSRLMDRIAEIDADLAKIEELQVAEGIV